MVCSCPYWAVDGVFMSLAEMRDKQDRLFAEAFTGACRKGVYDEVESRKRFRLGMKLMTWFTADTTGISGNW